MSAARFSSVNANTNLATASTVSIADPLIAADVVAVSNATVFSAADVHRFAATTNTATSDVGAVSVIDARLRVMWTPFP